MYKYPKTENLFTRTGKSNRVNVGDFRFPAFEVISLWDVTEKIDGANVHFYADEEGVLFFGRTENTIFSEEQLEVLHSTASKIEESLSNEDNFFKRYSLDSIRIYGELYGPKIQSGGDYADSISFCVFDMLINDSSWLDVHTVQENSKELGLMSVPYLGRMTTDEIVNLVSNGGFYSHLAVRTRKAEGVIATPAAPLFGPNGHRIKFKAKSCDFD